MGIDTSRAFQPENSIKSLYALRSLPPAYFLDLVSKAVLGNDNGVQAFVHVGLVGEAGARMLPIGDLFGIMRKRILGASLAELVGWRKVFMAFPSLLIQEHYREEIDTFLDLIAKQESQIQAATKLGSDMKGAVVDLGVDLKPGDR